MGVFLPEIRGRNSAVVRLTTGSNQVQSNNGKIQKKLDQLRSDKYVSEKRDKHSRNLYQGHSDLQTLDIRNPSKPISNAMRKKIYLTNDPSQHHGSDANSPSHSSALING